MCIAIAIDAGVPVPPREVLYRCFRTNPDGAGFAWADKHGVHVSKGYMDPLSAVTAMLKLPKEAPKLLHFRIGTHGAIVPEFCHPFPVVNHQASMYSLEGTWDRVLVHNGIMEKFGKNTEINSDSSEFAMRLAAGTASFKDVTSGNKVAVLDKDKGNTLVGKWIEEAPGLYYSNKDYLPYVHDSTVKAKAARTSFVGLFKLRPEGGSTVLMPDTSIESIDQLKKRFPSAAGFYWDSAENVYMELKGCQRPILIGVLAFAPEDIRDPLEIPEDLPAWYDPQMEIWGQDTKSQPTKEDAVAPKKIIALPPPIPTVNVQGAHRIETRAEALPENRVAGQPPRPAKKEHTQTSWGTGGTTNKDWGHGKSSSYYNKWETVDY
jgi:hypothetical protein